MLQKIWETISKKGAIVFCVPTETLVQDFTNIKPCFNVV